MSQRCDAHQTSETGLEPKSILGLLICCAYEEKGMSPYV